MFAMVVSLDEQGGDRVFYGLSPQECWDDFVSIWTPLDRDWEFGTVANLVEFYEFGVPVRVTKTTTVNFTER